MSSLYGPKKAQNSVPLDATLSILVTQELVGERAKHPIKPGLEASL